MRLLNKKNIADGVIFSGLLVNVAFIGIILYFYVM